MPRDLLRPVVERTVAVLRAGQRDRPPVAPPTTVAPLLRFRTLPATAHDTVVVALDADADLRARVQRDATERELGRVGWLWLTRPEGWDAELRDALGELAADDGAPSADAAGSDAQIRRRLAGAERAAARAAHRLERAETEAARLRAEVDELRAERLAHRALLATTTAELDDARRVRAQAVADLKRTEQLLARRDEDRRAQHARIAQLEHDLAAAQAARGARGAPPAREPERANPTPAIDLRALGDLADRIERAIGEAAVQLDALRAEAGLAPAATAAPGPPEAARRPPAPLRRRALRMPRGLTDDSVAAAAWLLTERPIVLVDGYNVSMAAWPDADIADQRQRLVRLLADMVARTPGVIVEIVFDGAATGTTPAALPARTGVNVRFTAPEVEADDELLAMIGRYPVPRPVVVASSDRRVRDGSRHRGANVLSAHQLLAVARG